mgnify:CR=1 FL=1
MNQTKSPAEENPFEAMHARFDLAAGKLGLEPGLYQILRKPDREITVALPNLRIRCSTHRSNSCTSVMWPSRP